MNSFTAEGERDVGACMGPSSSGWRRGVSSVTAVEAEKKWLVGKDFLEEEEKATTTSRRFCCISNDTTLMISVEQTDLLLLLTEYGRLCSWFCIHDCRIEC